MIVSMNSSGLQKAHQGISVVFGVASLVVFFVSHFFKKKIIDNCLILDLPHDIFGTPSCTGLMPAFHCSVIFAFCFAILYTAQLLADWKATLACIIGYICVWYGVSFAFMALTLGNLKFVADHPWLTWVVETFFISTKAQEIINKIDNGVELVKENEKYVNKFIRIMKYIRDVIMALYAVTILSLFIRLFFVKGRQYTFSWQMIYVFLFQVAICVESYISGLHEKFYVAIFVSACVLAGLLLVLAISRKD